eukprot:2674607-Karenia_brevis.AAC.1
MDRILAKAVKHIIPNHQNKKKEKWAARDAADLKKSDQVAAHDAADLRITTMHEEGAAHDAANPGGMQE